MTSPRDFSQYGTDLRLIFREGGGADISWTGGDPNPGNTVTYEVYFGTANPPATKVITQSAMTYDPPGNLLQCTTYYWKIIAKDSTNLTTPGPVRPDHGGKSPRSIK